MATTVYAEWLKQRYGSIEAIDKAHADIEIGASDYREWSLAVCEDAGIPWHGWFADALRCARKRLTFNESERLTVHILNKYHSDQVPALTHWLWREFAHTPYS